MTLPMSLGENDQEARPPKAVAVKTDPQDIELGVEVASVAPLIHATARVAPAV